MTNLRTLPALMQSRKAKAMIVWDFAPDSTLPTVNGVSLQTLSAAYARTGHVLSKAGLTDLMPFGVHLQLPEPASAVTAQTRFMAQTISGIPHLFAHNPVRDTRIIPQGIVESHDLGELLLEGFTAEKPFYTNDLEYTSQQGMRDHLASLEERGLFNPSLPDPEENPSEFVTRASRFLLSLTGSRPLP